LLVPALLAAAAVLLWWSDSAQQRLRGLQLVGASDGIAVGDRHAADAAESARGGGPDSRHWWTSPWLSAAVVVFTATRVVPGAPGYAVGLMAAGAVVLILRHAATAAEVQRSQRVLADLPLAVDLMVSCVSAGRPPGQGLLAVAASVGGPLGDDLRAVAGRLELGADPAAVWRDLAANETFAPLGRSLSRSARTGSSIGAALSRCAEDLRRERRAAADANARKVGVRAAAPLGACFLPAFFLIGILPTIIGSVRSLPW
jgi:Flp pilus assembly protein TadB